MPITIIGWSTEKDRDIHVVPGQPSPDLTNLHLFFQKTNGNLEWANNYLSSNTDVDLVFKPKFKPQGTQAANTHSGHGISVNTQNGVVTLDANLPSPRKYNFIMEVEAKDHSSGDIIDTDYIRVHAHQSIDQVWLTPGTLTVRPFQATRPETTNYEFSVRAQFDDGTVGDISNMPNLTWSPSANVNSSSGRLILKTGDASGNTIPITVTLPTAIGGATASGSLLVGDAWDNSNSIDISIVVGGGWPGTISPEKVPNVLLIGDGFTSVNQAAFNQYANSLVQFLKTNPLNKPYDVLSTSINFWSVLLPSSEVGASVNGEVYPIGSSSNLKVRYVPNPIKPPSGHTGRWSLQQLIYMVGLPVRNDETRTKNTIKNEWQSLIDPDPSPHINNALIGSWQRLAKRSMIDLKDSFLSVNTGNPVSTSAHDYINLDPKRIDRDKIDNILRALRDPRGIPVNDLWAKRSDNTKPNNYDLICILVAGQGRAVNSDGYFFVDILDDIKIAEISGKNAFRLNYQASDIPNTADNERSRVFAHELTHSFAIEDEYGEHINPPPNLNLDKYGNIMLESEAQDSGNIDGDKIKWNWHRIQKAAVIREAIVDEGGGKFMIPLILGQGHQFSVGDTVHLRFREYPKPLIHIPKLSPPLEITTPAPTADVIHVKQKTGVTFTYSNLVNPSQFIAEFVPGSIIYIPTPAPVSVLNPNTYPYAEIVAKNIKTYITDNHKPLTAYPSVVDDNDVQQPIIPGVSLPDCFSRNRPRIVGLYSGGKTYHKGIFHATGNCIMRDNHTDGREFCSVCRYVLTDIINPYKHWEIDREYQKIYPQE